MAQQDRWAEWILRRRSGNDPERQRALMEALIPIRDRVLDGAEPLANETLLDVGAGDGLLAFGALERMGENGQVIISDVSDDLLDQSRSLAEEAGVADRCRFLNAPAEDLSALADACVDAVTTRSVLIYVKDKSRAFAEFRRVLKSGGRLSIFEPINHFESSRRSPERFLGYDTHEVCDLAQKVWAVFERLQPLDSDPMFDFDERDLISLAERTGFDQVQLAYEASIGPSSVLSPPPRSWNTLLQTSGNPNIPTLGEAIDEALTLEEAERFATHLKPRVERGEHRSNDAKAYLRAVK